MIGKTVVPFVRVCGCPEQNNGENDTNKNKGADDESLHIGLGNVALEKLYRGG